MRGYESLKSYEAAREEIRYPQAKSHKSTAIRAVVGACARSKSQGSVPEVGRMRRPEDKKDWRSPRQSPIFFLLHCFHRIE